MDFPSFIMYKKGLLVSIYGILIVWTARHARLPKSVTDILHTLRETKDQFQNTSVSMTCLTTSHANLHLLAVPWGSTGLIIRSVDQGVADFPTRACSSSHHCHCAIIILLVRA